MTRNLNLRTLFAALFAVLALSLASVANAQTLRTSDSLTTAGATLANNATLVIDLLPAFRNSVTDLSSAIAAGNHRVVVRSLPDSTTGTVNLLYAHQPRGLTVAAPAGTAIDGTNPSETGYPVSEGETLTFIVTGRYLALDGATGTSLIWAGVTTQ